MASPNTTATLNRLAILHNRSLPLYLRYGDPYFGPKDAEAAEVFEAIAESNEEYAERFSELVSDERGQPASGEFPIVYSGYHDLSVDFLLTVMIREQQQDIAEIELCVDELRTVPMARALAEESLGAAKANLDTLTELQRPVAV